MMRGLPTVQFRAGIYDYSLSLQACWAGWSSVFSMFFGALWDRCIKLCWKCDGFEVNVKFVVVTLRAWASCVSGYGDFHDSINW